MTGSNEFKLNQPPEDGISSVKFSPNTSQFLLVSSWDTSVRLYDVPANSMRLKYQHTGAVLDCAFYVGVLGFRFCSLCILRYPVLIATLFQCWAEACVGGVIWTAHYIFSNICLELDTGFWRWGHANVGNSLSP